MFKLPWKQLGEAGVYTVGNLVVRAIPVVLLPILTRVLAPEEYGLIALFQGLVLVLTPLIGFSSNTVLSQKYYKFNESDRPGLNSAALRVTLIGVGVFLVPVIGISLFVPRLFGLSSFLTLLAFLVAFVNMIVTIGKTVAQMERRPIAFSALQIVGTSIDVGLSILFVVGMGLRVPGRISGIVLASLVSGVIVVLFLAKGHYVNQTWKTANVHTKDFIKAGWLLAPMSLGGWIFSLGDRFIISGMLNNSDVGYYSAALSFTTLVDMVTTPIALVWAPHFFRLMSKGGSSSRKAKRFTVLLCLGYIGLGFLFSWPLVQLANIVLGNKFGSSVSLIPQLIFGSLLRAMVGLLSYYILHEEQNHLLTLQFLVVSVVHVAAVFVGIRWAGIAGVSYAYLLSGGVSLFLMLVAVLITHQKRESQKT